MGVELKGNGPGEPPMNPAIAVPLFVVAGLITILFVWKTVIRIRHRRRSKAARQGTDQTQLSRTNRFNAALKKHLLYAPIWGNRHSREFRVFRLHMGSLPLRLEVICLLIYLSLNIIFIIVTVDWWVSDYTEKMFQLKFSAGHLAVMNTPGLVLGAGRNNPLVQLLGISFDTFNFMHRWVGRVITANAVIHMSAVLASKAYVYGTDYILYAMWQQKLYLCGLLAILGFLFIFIQSLSPARHAFYELFLHLHIALAIFSFVALWYHLQNLLQQRVLLGTLILWGLDRAGRLGILLWRNLSSRPTTATVEILPGSVARVDVAVARAWRFHPGQYMYLYMPCLGLWTSHPFTVAWSSTSDSLNMNEKRGSGDSLKALIGDSPTTTMSVLIKGQDGFTKRLLQKAEDSPEGRIQAMALAEGPFGGIHSLASYGTLLLIAGGIGITHPMSYLNEVVSTFTEQKTATRKVHLVWIVRSLDHLTWIQTFMADILGHESLIGPINANGHSYFQFPRLLLSISLHITAHKDTIEEYIPQPDSPWMQCAPPNVPVGIHHGKPCIKSVLEKEKAEQIGAMAVSVCGPGGLGDSVREAVRNIQGEKTVDLFEETFSW
ncbi:Riboflavin synthase-like beta-barrel [Penicillium concentricum]|uniref:ferric-chelate reductase (NADPH) n=1 Tax=Penicillium concentricum TaxID=293559 RepID=A0A9W9S6P7_9EURO|nr:Riboflavin synthase-like beta-barrel [Penicillium concentricum]KAJ5372360.1 Riboflavin synthase-like beta-barrel [Penicillium concentricum]